MRVEAVEGSEFRVQGTVLLFPQVPSPQNDFDAKPNIFHSSYSYKSSRHTIHQRWILVCLIVFFVVRIILETNLKQTILLSISRLILEIDSKMKQTILLSISRLLD